MSILLSIMSYLSPAIIGFIGGFIINMIWFDKNDRHQETQNIDIRKVSQLLCFIIEGRNIYLDQVYVEQDYPLLYSCRDVKDDKYLALCIDANKGFYLLAFTTDEILNQMVNKEITMREAFRQSEKIYSVVSCNNNIEDDTNIEVNFCDIDDEDLPVEGAYLE